MKPTAAFFKSIEIRRMPGFERGDLALPELSPGINVIYGPNASGKTTLGKAIHYLLRPGEGPNDHVSVRGSTEVNGQQIELDCDSGRIRAIDRAHSAPTDYPKLAPPDIGDRHVLALQDLIRTEHDHDLATQIVRELSGGYDVAAARKELNFSRQPTRRGKLTKELSQAEKRHQAALRRQDELIERQANLKRLQAEKAAAEEAQAEMALLDKAVERHHAEENVAEIRNRLRVFPAGVAKVAQHDIERLDHIHKALEAARTRRRKEEARRQKADRDLASVDLPGDGLPDGFVTEMRLRCRRLAGLRDEIDRREEAVDQSELELENARTQLGPDVSPEQTARLDAATVQEFFAFARQVERHRADRQAAEALRTWLETPEEATDPGDPERLHEGVILLHRWLGVSHVGTGSDSQYSLHFTIAGVALIILSIAMAIFVWQCLVFLLAGAAMIGWAFRPHSAEVLDRRAEMQHEYESLGIDAPSEWSPGTVRAFARDLQQRFDQATIAREKETRWAGLADKIEQMLDRDDKYDEQRNGWIERLGLDADSDDASLVLIAGNILRYRNAEGRQNEAQAGAQAARKQYRGLLDEINEALEAHDIAKARDAEDAHARVDSLEDRSQRYRNAAETVLDSASNLTLVAHEIEDLVAEQKDLFARTGLSADEESMLRDWARQRGRYDKVADELRLAEHNRDLIEAALADRPELLSVAPEELETRRQQCRTAAARLERINQEIGGIEEAIDSARHSTDMEARLAELAEAADALRAQRAWDYDALVGSVLADFVVEHQQAELPGVLKRARSLFARITHGRYELHVHQADPPEFRAFDTSRNDGLALDELSSGTRLQLLLAVRVAFVEQQEVGIKVPLILDETLGNSDERRAREIIDAVIEICRDGRQVFYFTAQHDEVGKWRELLRRCDDVPSRLIDLAELRKFSEAERVPPIEFDRPEPLPLPRPDGLEWSEYGRRLKVPAIDPHDETGNLHLWYLIEDVDLLHRLLEAGINHWGQLQTLASYGHVEMVRRDSKVYRQAEAAARAIETAVSLWRTGRGEPVDRAALVESGAVSDKYLDRVAELAEDEGLDAQRLVDALEQGKVRGFRTDKREALAEYLASGGYLAEDEPLPPEEIHDRTRAQLFDEIDRGLLRRARVARLVDSVLAGGKLRGA
jgi:uncharacterized protein YhaN